MKTRPDLIPTIHNYFVTLVNGGVAPKEPSAAAAAVAQNKMLALADAPGGKMLALPAAEVSTSAGVSSDSLQTVPIDAGGNDNGKEAEDGDTNQKSPEVPDAINKATNYNFSQ
eukprot:5533832-Amphidinium_carterae.1